MKKDYFLKILIMFLLLFGYAKLDAQVTIGADAAPKPFSVLELISEYKSGVFGGMRLPLLTTAQRDGITDLSNPEAVGLTIFNTTTNCLEFWNGTKWISLCADNLAPLPQPEDPNLPPAPSTYCLEGTICFDVLRTPGGSGIEPLNAHDRITGHSNFTAPNARTYTLTAPGAISDAKFYITNDNEKVVKSYTESSTSNTATLTITFKDDVITAMTGKKAKFTILAQFKDAGGTHYQKNLTVKVQDATCGCVLNTYNCEKIAFLNYNLGADPAIRTLSPAQQAAYTTPAHNYGGLYQWGRAANIRSAPTTEELSTVDVPPHGNFIIVNASPFDWRTPKNDNLWQDGIRTDIDPCPPGWRVPSQAEWQSIFLEEGDGLTSQPTANAWNWNDTGAGTVGFLITPPNASTPAMFLPAAGWRVNLGFYIGVGTTMTYWSSTKITSGTTTWVGIGVYCLWGGGNQARTLYQIGKCQGQSIRCVAE